MHCDRRKNGARELALYRQIQGEGNAGGLAELDALLTPPLRS